MEYLKSEFWTNPEGLQVSQWNKYCTQAMWLEE